MKETNEQAAKRILANNIDGLRDALKDDDLFFFYKGVVECYGEGVAEWKEGQHTIDTDDAYSEGFKNGESIQEEKVELLLETLSKVLVYQGNEYRLPRYFEYEIEEAIKKVKSK